MKAFEPPKYTERSHLIFEKKTGKVIATEVRLSLEGDFTNKQCKQPSLIETISKKLDIRQNELDLLVFKDKKICVTDIKKVNIKSGKPIFKKKNGQQTQAIFPRQIGTP